MEKPQDFAKICRICLSDKDTIISVFKLNVSKKLMACAAIQVCPNDGLPAQICKICAAKLHTSYQFKKQCERSDVKLRHIVGASENNHQYELQKQNQSCQDEEIVNDNSFVFVNCDPLDESGSKETLTDQYSYSASEPPPLVSSSDTADTTNSIKLENCTELSYNEIGEVENNKNLMTNPLIEVPNTKKMKKETFSDPLNLPISEEQFSLNVNQLHTYSPQQSVKNHQNNQMSSCTTKEILDTSKSIGHSITESKSYNLHLSSHINKKRFVHSICDEIYQSTEQLKRHFNSQTDDRSSCCYDFNYDPGLTVDASEIEIDYKSNSLESLPKVTIQTPILLSMVEKNAIDSDIDEAKKKIRRKDFCFYCKTLVSNFARHLERNHVTEIEVQSIFSLKTGSRERKDLLTALRKKGNFLNRNSVVKPMRSSSVTRKVLPCIHCMGFYSAKHLWKHKKVCLKNNETTSNHQAEAQTFLVNHLRVDTHLKELVFSRMRPDEISMTVKKDALICAFGSRYIKIHRKKHFISIASRKMRELAKLLHEVKKLDSDVQNLLQALQPKYYDYLVTATKAVAKYDAEKEFYVSPTYALNIGTALKQCCEIAIIYALKKKDVYAGASTTAEADLKTMIQLLNSNWRFDVTNSVENNLNVSKWNKVTLIPLAKDLKLLKNYLIAEANKAALKLLNNNHDKNSYTVLQETVFCRVFLLNQERTRELQRLLLLDYERDLDNQECEEFENVIGPIERILMQKLKKVIIRGMRALGVTIFFSNCVQEHISFLLKYRLNFINNSNPYLFGNPNSNGSICGYKVLKKYAILCGTKNSNAIVSSKLRNHLAILTQILNMGNTDLEQLSSLLGHTPDVRTEYNKLPDDIFQVVKISKLLMSMKTGSNQMNRISNVITSKENIENKIAVSASRKKRILIPWTQEQKNVVANYFDSHIQNKLPPRKNECEILIKEHPVLLENKNWLKIKVFVQNLYTKK